jgi:hypothetical protein
MNAKPLLTSSPLHIIVSQLEVYVVAVVNNGEATESLSLWTLPIIRNSKCLENTTFWKLNFFPLFSGEGRETPTLLGPLETVSSHQLFRILDEE